MIHTARIIQRSEITQCVTAVGVCGKEEREMTANGRVTLSNCRTEGGTGRVSPHSYYRTTGKAAGYECGEGGTGRVG